MKTRSKKALQDRGKPLVPNRIDEDQRFGRRQPIGIGRDGRPVELDVMVLHPLPLTHDRIKAFGVEVAIVDLVAARTQSRDDLPIQRRAETYGDWIGV
jgi:hypothetical protein